MFTVHHTGRAPLLLMHHQQWHSVLVKTLQAPAALLAPWPQPRLWHAAIQPQPQRMETSHFLLSTNLLTPRCSVLYW